jgi:hypothetical protein
MKDCLLGFKHLRISWSSELDGFSFRNLSYIIRIFACWYHQLEVTSSISSCYTENSIIGLVYILRL